MLPQDGLIRNLFFADQYDEMSKMVERKAFRPRKDDIGNGLSFTATDPDILSLEDIDEYLEHASKGLEDNPDAPERLGCCYVTHEQLSLMDLATIEAEAKRDKSAPPLDPMPVIEVISDELSAEVFDRSHCLLQDTARATKCPENAVQRLLAHYASRNEFVIPLIPKPAV